jgi:hypothetical protein
MKLALLNSRSPKFSASATRQAPAKQSTSVDRSETPAETVTFSSTSNTAKKKSLATQVLRGLGVAGGVAAAVLGGTTGLIGAAVGVVVGAGIGVLVNGVKNFDLYSPRDLKLAEGAKNGAAVGAAAGGAIGAVGGAGAVSVAGGFGAVLVGGAAIGVLNVFSDGLYNK